MSWGDRRLVRGEEQYGSRWSRRFFNIWDWLPTALAFLVVYGMLIGFFSRRWPLDLLFSLTTTSGGDTGAHHYPAQYLIQELLPNWRLTGWAPGWYAGMPMLTFYFPFPFLVIALLDYILPYTVAFKLGTVLGVFPAAAHGLRHGSVVAHPQAVPGHRGCVRGGLSPHGEVGGGAALFHLRRQHTQHPGG